MTYRQLYFRERRRIQRTIRNYIRRGLDVNLVLPKIPKRITAGSVRRLEKITLQAIRESAQGPDYETGEVLDYGRFVSQEKRIRKEARKKEKLKNIPNYADVALDNFYTELENYDERAREMVESALNAAISYYGIEEVADVISEMKESGELMTAKESYNIGAIIKMIRDFRGILAFSREELNRLQAINDEVMFSEDTEWFE